MSTRKRLTEPVEVRLYMARSHLKNSNEACRSGRPLAAMAHLMQAIVNLKKIEARLDAADAD
jgi:hypothetical protein